MGTQLLWRKKLVLHKRRVEVFIGEREIPNIMRQMETSSEGGAPRSVSSRRCGEFFPINFVVGDSRLKLREMARWWLYSLEYMEIIPKCPF
ncbi:hypothetical protein FCM35_KLT02884 [Carex littledalei]|uniref:Uncharacterized protein n=1 Tax=Carex littledalei TaxID=544730 RepID=A0A833R9A7_9POAL|nr:hypothetical protein FCM35_KLT02884 [Carex littledalei]